MNISTRLKLSFVAIISVFLVLTGITVWRIEMAVDAKQRMTRSAELLQLASNWQGDVRQNSARSLAVSFADGSTMLNFFKDDMAATSRGTNETQKAFLTKAQGTESLVRAERVGEVRKQWLVARDEVNALKTAADDAGARNLVSTRLLPMTQDYIRVTQALVDGELADVRAAEQDVSAMFRQLYMIGGAFLALAVGIAVVVGWRLSSVITNGLNAANQAVKRIGGGDLRQHAAVTGNDEIGQLLQALNTMQGDLSRVVHNVRQGSEGVATASAEIAEGNHDLSARTEQQASALEQTASSMEQLSATVRQNADNAREANQLAQSASTVAVQGGEVVGQVVTTMKDINESSKKIADIIQVIDGIAFQTNILALNAAVEAARAGEQGRGFAVVASEVRSLAGRSAEAAKEIKSLINASVARVAQGSALVDKAGVTMAEVVSSIRRVNDIMGEISLASNEQALGVSQVGQAVVQMDQTTQQNAALVEQMAAAASSLKSQAEELVQTVAVFTIDAVTPGMGAAQEFAHAGPAGLKGSAGRRPMLGHRA